MFPDYIGDLLRRDEARIDVAYGPLLQVAGTVEQIVESPDILRFRLDVTAEFSGRRRIKLTPEFARAAKPFFTPWTRVAVADLGIWKPEEHRFALGLRNECLGRFVLTRMVPAG